MMLKKSRRLVNLIAVLVLLLASEATYAETPLFADSFETLPITVIAVDPPLVQRATGVVAQAHVDGLYAAPQAVRLHGPAAQQIEPAFQFDPGFPGGFTVSIPPGLAAGEWSLEVEPAGGGEPDSLVSAFLISDDISIAFESTPAVLSASQGGALQLVSGNAFIAIPQVMLRPSGAAPSVAATPLQGIEISSSAELHVPVPPGFAAGDYDLAVVNPDGTAGVLPAGLALSESEAPSIASVQPAAAIYSSNVDFSVIGNGFEANSLAQLICDDGNTASLTANLVSATELELQYAGTLFQSAICVVEISNSDGQISAWSGVRMQGASESFGVPALVSAMSEARRAPALAMARLSGTRHRVYAIGGDDGSDANVHSTVEFADVSAFGATAAWRPAMVELPAPRSFAWAVQHGRFLYLAGGFDGNDEVDTVYRAEILDSGAAPAIDRYRLSVVPEAPGFTSTLQAYRVAPVFDADHPTNPSGTGTAGPVFVARVPAQAGISAALQWQAVPGAIAYRVFTQPAGSSWDGNPGSLELLAVTPATNYVHTGDMTTDPAIRPLEAGETGQWHAINDWSLAAPRSRAAGALSPLPGRPDDVGLYLFGGLDGAGDTLGNYTYTVITDAGSASPDYGSWTAGVGSLSVAVQSPVAWPYSSNSADNHWIFVGTGLTGGSAPENFIDRGTVAADGDLGTLASMDTTPPSTGAAGATALTRTSPSLISDGEIGLTAGWAGAASDQIRDSGIVAGPETGNWNILGHKLQQARIYAGSASGGPFIFIAGGSDADGTALTSVERIAR